MSPVTRFTNSTPPSPATTKLALRTAHGLVYRTVLSTPPRDCTPSEIPIIDLAGISSPDLAVRAGLAKEIRAACVNNGFFYVKNHGIGEDVIERAREQCLAFFKQPVEQKMMVTKERSKFFNGYFSLRSSNTSPGESIDVKENLGWRYDPKYDPVPKDPSKIPEEVRPHLRGEDFVWEGTSHLPNFKEDTLAYWSACLTLSRKLVRIFALSLDLPEDYFDSRTTYPGADGVYNYYPENTAQEKANDAVGLGSHTDLQLFTLLWQDMVGGLQVLTKEGQWIRAVPVKGTIVVNIGDFMMRLCNDLYKSTVHRVYNKSTVERISMPFFFGLNFNCVEGVVPSCASETNPPKYEPISCGEWCQRRFQIEDDEMKKKVGAEKHAPSALIVAA